MIDSLDDRRLLDLEWRREIGRSLGTITEKLEKLDTRVDANTLQIDLCIKAVNKLSHETEGPRHLWRDGAGAIRFVRALWKPLIVAVLTVNVVWAGVYRVLFDAWPGWYVELVKLLR